MWEDGTLVVRDGVPPIGKMIVITAAWNLISELLYEGEGGLVTLAAPDGWLLQLR